MTEWGVFYIQLWFFLQMFQSDEVSDTDMTSLAIQQKQALWGP